MGGRGKLSLKSLARRRLEIDCGDRRNLVNGADVGGRRCFLAFASSVRSERSFAVVTRSADPLLFQTRDSDVVLGD